MGTLFVVAGPRDQHVLLDIFLKKIVAGLGNGGNSPDARRAASISNISAALCISLQQMMLMRGILAVPVWLSSAQSACMAALIYGSRPTQLTAAHGLGLLVQINMSDIFLKDTLSKLLRDAAALAQSHGWVLAAEAHVPARLGCVLGLAAVAAAAGSRAAIYLPDILECDPLVKSTQNLSPFSLIFSADILNTTWKNYRQTLWVRDFLVLLHLCEVLLPLLLLA